MSSTYLGTPTTQALSVQNISSLDESSVAGPDSVATQTASSSRPSKSLKIAHLLHGPSVEQPMAPGPTVSPTPPLSSTSGNRKSSSKSPSISSSAKSSMSKNGRASSTATSSQTGHLGSQPTKRAYRQRRKDPSCDACRERKVKCDASESSSCTECANRNMKCLFTKETNRRMSSIKQVQDLERQLAHTKQQLSRLRSAVPGMHNGPEEDENAQHAPRLAEVWQRPARSSARTVPGVHIDIQSQMRKYGQGLISFPPSPTSGKNQGAFVESDNPPLPPSPVANLLLRYYYSHIHPIMPVVHWPTFVAEFEQVDRAGTLCGTSRAWASALFGIFACGSLHSSDQELISKGTEYMRASVGLCDIFQDHFEIHGVRIALLISMFLFEINMKSSSWVWVGTAVAIAHDIGLNIESSNWSLPEAEIRRRTWWSLYSWERTLALELGRPFMIRDDESEIDLPSAIDEQSIEEGRMPSTVDENCSSLHLAVINVARSVPHLTRALKDAVVPDTSLDAFEQHFRLCFLSFPPACHLTSREYLDPRFLPPIFTLQNARLILHRHNLSPASSAITKRAALKKCLSIARDSASLVARCQNPVANGSIEAASDWRYLLMSSATTPVCTHLWRCTLFLLLCGEYHDALLCIQTSATIGEARVANTSCGRYIAFFLHCLSDKMQQCGVEDVRFEDDDELLSYATGDLQSRSEGSWIWQSSSNQHRMPGSGTARSFAGSTRDAPTKTDSALSNGSQPNQEWEGWEWVERVTLLLYDQQQRQRQGLAQATAKQQEADVATKPYPLPEQRIEPAYQLPLAPADTPAKTENPPNMTNGTSSRMAIASII